MSWLRSSFKYILPPSVFPQFVTRHLIDTSRLSKDNSLRTKIPDCINFHKASIKTMFNIKLKVQYISTERNVLSTKMFLFFKLKLFDEFKGQREPIHKDKTELTEPCHEKTCLGFLTM